jgi:septum formation protein
MMKVLSNLANYKIILASNSPRRKELLSGLGVEYVVMTLPNVNEEYPSNLKGEDIPNFIAHRKADAYKKFITSNELVITADTIVWLNGEALGKPADVDEAKVMLHKLSDSTHQVITSVCITTAEFQKSFNVISEVTFSPLSDDEINYYVSRYLPLDKAGAYGVQEWIGFVGVRDIKGSYYNVMGLPVQRLYTELKKIK